MRIYVDSEQAVYTYICLKFRLFLPSLCQTWLRRHHARWGNTSVMQILPAALEQFAHFGVGTRLWIEEAGNARHGLRSARRDHELQDP